MTINATAMWLLALYQVVAEEQGCRSGESQLTGTTQNDIIKEYLSRGTYVFPPEHSLRLTTDLIAYTVTTSRSGTRSTSAATTCRRPARRRCRSWRSRSAPPSPSSTRCATPARSSPSGSVTWSARISFFVNAGVRFVEEMCKMRAFTRMWDTLTLERYGVQDPKHAPLPVRRPGQLARPHRGAAREQRAAHRARDARRHPVEGRARPRRPAPRLERSARAAAPVGPAVVAADPAGARLRVRPARVRRPVRRARTSSRRRSPT